MSLTGAGCGGVLLAHPSADLYGSDRMLLESIRALRSVGVPVSLTVPENGPLVPIIKSTGASVEAVAVPVLRKSVLNGRGIVRYASSSLASIPAMVSAIRRCHPDLVYVNTVTIPTWIAAARLAGVPVVCHVHEAEQSFSRPVAATLASQLMLARRVLVNSRAAMDSITAASPWLRGRLRLLYNGVAEPSTPVLPSRNQLEGPLRLVLVGRLSPRKGTDIALDAVADLTRRGLEVRLDLVGDVFPGYEWYAEHLKRRVSDEGIADKVHFAGFRTDVWPAFAAADIVLVPSRTEPFGNVAVEAALAQRPVVATAVQGLREIVTSGRTGLLVPPDNPVALADAVVQLVSDWQMAKHMASRAQAEARERFGTTKYAENLLDLLTGAGLARRSG